MKCKFKINKLSIEEGDVKQPGGDWGKGPVATVEATTVSDGNKENEEFFAATPSGNLNLQVVNAMALTGLQEGDEIFITIEKAAAPAAEGAGSGE